MSRHPDPAREILTPIIAEDGDVPVWNAALNKWAPATPGAASVPSASTTVAGKVELATDGEDAASVVVQGNDGRLSNARTPTSHTHAPGEITGTAVVTADARLSDARTPTTHTHAEADVTSLVTDLAGKATAGDIASAVSEHASAADPHAGYQLESEKAAANGYASLGADGKVPSAQLPAGGSDPYAARLVLGADKPTGANVTPVTLGLSFAFEANSKYAIDIYALVAPTAAGTGCGFLIDVSAAVTYVGTHVTHQLAATGTLSGATSVGDAAATLSAISSGMPGTASYPVIGGGILISGANAGTATIFFRSETTAVTTCKAGTMILVTKVA